VLKLYGYTTQQLSESMNRTNMAARKGKDFYKSCLTLVELGTKRFFDQKAEAFESEAF